MGTSTRSEAMPTGAGGKPQQQKATEVRREAAQGGRQVAHQAAGQGKQVAAETRRQARDLMGEASAQVRQQAGTQQKRAVDGLRAVGMQFQSMAGKSEQDGLAKEAICRASDAAEQAAGWLEQREPGDLVNEVRDYAREHPGTFLAGATAVGLLVGRLARGLTATDGRRGHEPRHRDQGSERASAPSGETENKRRETGARESTSARRKAR